ncbi:MAG: ABC transporter permease [Halieaceae bacterium]|jgi:lipopolysaccharide transport system permease protein|nr:ABC transporter permease [Halieaceae bacterium]
MRFRKRHAELVYHCALSDLKRDSDQAYLGMLWWVLDPLIYLCTFYLIFEVIMQRGGPGFIHFLLTGLVFWRWFDSSVRLSAMSIRKYQGIINQVYLPKILLPLITVTSNLMKFSLVLVLFALFLALSGYPPGSSWLAIPLLLLVQFVLVVGASLLVSAIIPLVPDLMQLVNYGMTLMFFMSGIFFDLDSVTGPLRTVLYFNPMAIMLSAWRDLLLEASLPDLAGLTYVLGFGLVLVAVGAWLLNRFDLRYPRLVN